MGCWWLRHRVAWGGSGLGDAGGFDKGGARGIVRVAGGFRQRKDRRDAGVGAVEDGGPFVAGAGAERGGEFLFQVPPKEAVYIVKASMKGYGPEQKEAAISGEDRVDVNLVLTPGSK